MPVAKKDISSVLKSGLPATAYVEDYETRRVLESIKTALRLLGNILNGTDKTVDTPALLPEVRIDAGPNIQVARKGTNWFRVSAMFALPDSDEHIGGGGANFLVELGDVRLTSPTSGDDLEYDGTNWINRAKTRPFRFVKTSSTGGTVARGLIYVKGVSVTSVSGWTDFATTDLTLSGVTTSTKYWIAVTLATGACAWSSGVAFPTSTAAVEIWPILEITCSGSVITSWYQHQWVNIHQGVNADFSASAFSLGYSVAGGNITTTAGSLRKSDGSAAITIASQVFALGGTKYTYVQWDRAAGTAVVYAAAVIPSSTVNVVIFPLHQFDGTGMVAIYHLGDITLDTPLR